VTSRWRVNNDDCSADAVPRTDLSTESSADDVLQRLKSSRGPDDVSLVDEQRQKRLKHRNRMMTKNCVVFS